MTIAPLPAQRRRLRIARKHRVVFLACLAEGFAVRHAALQTPIAFQRWYELRADDEAFAAEWAQAEERGVQRMEDEAMRRAVDGWDEPVYQKGEQVGVVRKYSDSLLALLLRGRRPDVYRDNAQVQVSAPTVFVLESAFSPPRQIEAEIVDSTAVELPEGES